MEAYDESALESFIFYGNFTEDANFIHIVSKEIHRFLQKYKLKGAVLAFPCFNSRRRFIVHQLSQRLFSLDTFSVGIFFQRRIIICSKSVKKLVNVEEIEMQSEQVEKAVDSKKGAVAKSKRASRPDAPIYIPPAVRRQSTSTSKEPPCTKTSHGRGKKSNEENDGTANNNDEFIDDKLIENKKYNVPDTDMPSLKKCTISTEHNVPINKNSHCIFNNSTFSKTDLNKTVVNKIPIDDGVKDNDQEKEELLQARKEINKKKRIIKQSFENSNELIINHDNNYVQNPGLVDDWEQLLDDKLGTDVIVELLEHVEGSVTIQIAEEDYTEYEETRTLDGDFAHVLEIYDFPEDFQTRDIVSILKPHKLDAFHIKWVDDSHALVVFSSGFVAQRIFKTFSHPLIKLRPLTQASKQSIIRAIKCPNAMQPSAVRPQTCPQAARRMVTGALGLRLGNAREERAQEIKILKEAREKKKLSAKQEEDAWLGKPRSSME